MERKSKILHQHLVFARSKNNYLIFLVALYFTNPFCFHKVVKCFDDLSCIHIVKLVKKETRKFVYFLELEKNEVTFY